MIWKVLLTPRQRFGFFLAMSFLFILPLILADYSYIDDNWRLFKAGSHWVEEGRFMVELLYHGLSFTAAAPNIFPLPLILSTLCVALALDRLSVAYFSEPTIAECLVVLPLLYTPFLLQAFSYQYDGAGTMFGIVLVVYSITFRHRLLLMQLVLPSVMLTLALGFYQLTINVFIGLCCVDILRAMLEKSALKEVLSMLGLKVLHVLLAAISYFFCVFMFLERNRTELVQLNAQGFASVIDNFRSVNETVVEVQDPAAYFITMMLLALAMLCVSKLAVQIFFSDERFVFKVLRGLLIASAAFLLFFSLSGAALFFRDFNGGARTLLGATALLIGLFYLSHHLLRSIHSVMVCLLLVPVTYMLCFSYAYGRLLVIRKELENNLTWEVAHDIDRNAVLRKLKVIYVQPSKFDVWLPAGEGSMALMPTLKYVLNINDYLVLPEALRRFGVASEWLEGEKEMASLTELQGLEPMTDRRFYAIYVAADHGFLVFKDVRPSGRSAH